MIEELNIITWLSIGAEASVLIIGAEDETFISRLRGKIKDITICGKEKAFRDVQIRKFNYVILLGALERAADYIEGAEPQKHLLQQAYDCLQTDGTLAVAMDNCYGLKYWAGSKEEITGRYFSSLEQNALKEGHGLLSAKAVEKLLDEIPVREWKRYYPYPDYRLAKYIYSDDYLPRRGELKDNFHNFTDIRLQMFNEEYAFDKLLEEEKFPLFTNSYLYIVK